MSDAAWVWILTALTAFACTSDLAVRIARRLHLECPNFRGDIVPVSGGIAYLAMSLPFLTALRLAFDRLPVLPYILTMAGFGTVGLVDDLYGGTAARGFSGHLRALRAGRVTTGMVKAMGGVIVAACVVCIRHAGEVPVMFAVDTAIIALAANALNLLDTRPGRAQAGFLLCVVVVAAFAPLAAPGGWWAIAPVCVIVVAVLRYWRNDAAGVAMMGDTGANAIGAIAGLTAVDLLPATGRLLALILLVTLNLAGERVSFSVVIDRSPILRALDARLGVRGTRP